MQTPDTEENIPEVEDPADKEHYTMRRFSFRESDVSRTRQSKNFGPWERYPISEACWIPEENFDEPEPLAKKLA